MKLLDGYGGVKLMLIGLAGAMFIVYPNITCFAWDLSFLDGAARRSHIWFFVFRYLFFTVLILMLVRVNLWKMTDFLLKKRFAYNLLITAAAYALYVGVSVSCCTKADCFGGTLLFQFSVVWIICTVCGHVAYLYSEQRKKEQEIELLKIENLQSRCDALTNQINPHFFFNSLNGLTALIRKNDDEKTLVYVNKLSDVFRYILQSDKKGLVRLDDELEFVHAFRYMMEVRFANKLVFDVEVGREYNERMIPVLSLLPLIDNVVVHNMIDSQHKMTVRIWINERLELAVSNPMYPKMSPPVTNGTGIRNLENRFSLLMDKHHQIRIENDGTTFTVFLPLK
jgi:hypothetical protein